MELLKAFHDKIEVTLSSLAVVARPGFALKYFNGQKVRLPRVLCSYVAGFCKASDITSVKRGVLTTFPCHRCPVKNASFNKFGVIKRRSINLYRISTFKDAFLR